MWNFRWTKPKILSKIFAGYKKIYLVQRRRRHYPTDHFTVACQLTKCEVHSRSQEHSCLATSVDHTMSCRSLRVIHTYQQVSTPLISIIQYRAPSKERKWKFCFLSCIRTKTRQYKDADVNPVQYSPTFRPPPAGSISLEICLVYSSPRV